MNYIHKVAVIGDSVLKGVVFNEVSGRYQALTESCATMVQKCLNISILNRSRFGNTIDKGNQLLDIALKKGLDCELALLEFGGNDCDFDWKAVSDHPEEEHQPRTQLDHFLSVLSEMVQKLKKNGIEPVLMSLPPVDGERYFQHLVQMGFKAESLLHFLGDPHMISRFHESYSLAVTRFAREAQCIYVPIREAFLSSFKYGKLMCVDGIHPNQEGHYLMKQVFIDTISTGKSWRALPAT